MMIKPGATTFRVLFDYGDIEITTMFKTASREHEQIQNEVIDHLAKEGWTLPPTAFLLTITHAPEWEED